MIRVLFVCLGNICRSPMAEAVFKQAVYDAGLSSQIESDSAGTSGYHNGETAHRGTLAILKKHSIPYSGRSRQLKATDFRQFQYILAMDGSNLRDIQRYSGSAEVAMFMSYASQAETTTTTEIPDPYYDGRFEEVYQLVKLGSDALLDKIRKDHNL